MKNQTGALRRHAIAAAVAAAFGSNIAPALAQLPTGPTVVNGSAGIVTNGSQMTITNSANAVLDWQSFNIGSQNRVRFEQPGASSQVLNRVVGNDPSNILGSLSSNGGVWLVNPHGVLFGSNARVDVAGLVASALPLSNDDFLTGRLRFGGAGLAGGQVLNQGEIGTSFGGHVWLVGTSVRNEGLVRSPGGHIVLAAGNSIELVDSGLPNVAVRVTAPDNGAVNLGTLLAPAGGSIDIHGGIVNQQGIVRADSIGLDPAGRVVIRAQGDVTLGASSETGADGRAGAVLVESAGGTTLVQGRVSATGTPGAGGQVQLLGKDVGVVGQAVVDASGAGGGGAVLVGGDVQGANPAVRNAVATYLGPNASVRAGATDAGDGGKVILWGDQATRVYGTIAAGGGPGGGNGGLVETSGHFLDVKPKQIDVGAAHGRAGTWLLDPGNITITGCCSQEGGLSHDDTADFSVTSYSDDAFIEADLIASQLRLGTKVIIKTGISEGTTQVGDIVVDHDIVLEDGAPAGGGLNLFAHNDIVVSPGVKINLNHNAIPVNLTADFDNDGAGSIALREGAQITTGGSIGLKAATFGATPNGTILLEKNTVLDAGTGLVDMTAARLDMRDGSQVNAGHISAAVDAITMTNASFSAADTSDSGVSVTAKHLALNGGAIQAYVSDANGQGGSSIAITADTLDVTNGTIAASSSSAGATTFSGTLSITSSTINLTNATLSANSTGTADATTNGTMAITSDDMVLKNSSLVASGPMSISSGRFAFSDTSGEAQVSAAGIGLFAHAIELDHASFVSSTVGDAIDITADTLKNTSSVLSAPNGRWLVHLGTGYTSFPAADLGTLDYKFVQVDASDASPAVSGVGQNGIMMADPLAVRIKVNATRPYDGTTQATFTDALSIATLPGFGVQSRAGDGAFAGTFQDRNAGTDKPIAYGGESPAFDIVTTAGVPVYGATQTYIGDILPRAVTAAGLVAANKVYDGTRAATVSGSLSGILAGDTVTLMGATGLFDTKNAGTGKTVTISGGTLAGADAGNYTLAGGATTTADITPRPITVAGIQAADKVYDGTRAATLSGGFTDALPGDVLTLGTTTGTFDTRNVGTNKTVTFTGGVLAGADSANYQLTGPLATLAAITPRPITVAGIQAADKVYDGTTAATLSGGFTAALPGDVLTLGATTGTFDTKNVGTNKTVTFTGGVLAGADSSNYQLTGPLTTQAAITPRPITAAGIQAADKVYDGTTAATLSGGFTGALPGDVLTLGTTAGTFDTKNVGANKTVTFTGGVLTGADASNYRLTGPLTTQAAITPRPITASGIQAADKVYDGTTAATLSGGFTDALAGDRLTLGTTTATFDTRNAGTDKAVTFGAGVLAGPDAGNYQLAGPLTTRAAITPRPVTIAITGTVSKEYDATTGATLGTNQFAVNDVVAGDTLTVSGPAQGSYATPGVGHDKTVNASGSFQIAGADAPNYRVGTINLTGGVNVVDATASGNVGTITPATLTYVAGPAVREPGLPVTGLDGTVTGFKGSDTLASATTGTLAWESKVTRFSLPGAYAVDGTGLSADNYTFDQAPGNATALTMRFDLSPAKTQAQGRAQDDSTHAIAAALRAALPVLEARGSGGGVFDRSSLAAARTFGAIPIGAMNQDELAAMLAQRRDFKRKLFADAIYKLEIDPSLADVQPCATVADASTGACRITTAQLELIHASKAVVAKTAVAKTAHVPQIERKVVVLFGINDYADKTIPQLENAVPDVDAVAKIFAEKLGYEVRVVRNPDKAAIIRTLNGLAAEMNSQDSVVIYYAGHGYSLEKNGAGYWIPSDAKAVDPHGWISNNDVAKLLGGIRSKQMALISDSCYSGAFAREGMDAVGHDVTVDDVLTKRSVVVLSSGGDEPVADEGKEGHSIFAWNLMRVVGGVQDWKPGSTIFTDVQTGVKKEFPQTPKYGAVTAAGHQRGGDYLFELR